MTRRHFPAGDVVIRQGEPGEEFFLISDGNVEVMREGYEVARLGPGDFFGEAAVISGDPRNATVVATEGVDAYVLGKDDFRGAVDRSESFRHQLLRVYFQRH